MLIADAALMVRLESLVVAEIERFVRSATELFEDSRARTERIGEGLASFGGGEIPFNEAVGFGMTRPVTRDELDAIEAFYDECGAAGEVLVPTLAGPGLLAELARRGWMPSGFEDMLVAPLAAAPLAAASPPAAPPAAAPLVPVAPSLPGVDLRVVEPHERARWGRCVVDGFAGEGGPSASELRFGEIIAGREDAMLVWAWADGVPVATGELVMVDGVGWLSADTTLPSYRGRGIQQALQRMRVDAARQAGCDLAVSEATPGTTSHRNQQRQGFRVAYTHVAMERAARP